MLSVLGLLGGKAIGKYVIIAGLVAAVAFGMWLAVQSYNKAIEKAARIEAKLQQANSETEVANANTEAVAQMYTESQRQVEQERRTARRFRIQRNDATAVIANALNLRDFSAVNRGLCVQLSRINGYKIDSCETSMSEAGTPDSKKYSPIATIDRTSIINLESALGQCADYIESVEGLNADDEKQLEHDNKADSQ